MLPRRVPSGRFVVMLLAGLGVLLGMPGASVAQSDRDGPLTVGERAPAAPLSAPVGAYPEEVSISFERLGVGGRVRGGSWAGFRIAVAPAAVSGDGIDDVIVRLIGYDPDGDRALYQRRVSLPNAVWLYARMPHQLSLDTTVEVRVYEARDGGDPWLGGVAGRLLGVATRTVSAPVRSNAGMVGVIGRSALGVENYGTAALYEGMATPTAHEPIEIVSGINADERSLPDRWYGLDAFGALFWTQSVGPHDPANLLPGQIDALRQWILQGGHLVVVLPVGGRTWLENPQNPFTDLLPVVEPTAFRLVTDDDLIQQLVGADLNREFPPGLSLRPLVAAEGAGAQEAMPILQTATGDCIAMRRLVGLGAVTLISLDLSSLGLELPRTDQFWNRIVGRRGLFPPGRELDEMIRADRIPSVTRRDAVQFDTDIEDRTSMDSAATGGVLLGIVLFGGYWLVAGPGGFHVLNKRGLRRHAWLGFVAAGAVFTGLSWGAATALGDRGLRAKVVLFCDSVHGQGVNRVTGWSTVLLPGYDNRTEVSVMSPGEREVASGVRAFEPVIAAWAGPIDEPSGATQFLESNDYPVAASQPGVISVPARSTAKKFAFSWLGASDDARTWQLPVPFTEPGDPGPGRIEFWSEEKVPPGERAPTTEGTPQLLGSLVNTLPVPVTRAQLLVVDAQSWPVNGLGDRAVAPVYSYPLTRAGQSWAPGARVDLAELTRTERRSAQLLNLSSLDQQTVARGRGPADRMNRLITTTLFEQMDPPRADGRSAYAVRYSTHGLGMDRWMTQPCVILVGLIDIERDMQAGLPLPLEVEGRRVPSVTGEVLFRVVYPLEPSAAGPRSEPEVSGSPGAEASRGSVDTRGTGP